MLTVFKYPLQITGSQVIRMPTGATILSFQSQFDEPCIWALVDSEFPEVDREFQIIGTGHPIGEKVGKRLTYIGTIQAMSGKLIWHLFEVVST